MTMPEERTRAVLQAGDFLRELANGSLPCTPEVQRQAKALLRHYPGNTELMVAHRHAPGWFGPAPGKPDATSDDPLTPNSMSLTKANNTLGDYEADAVHAELREKLEAARRRLA
jgi:hypothetical protein